MDGLLILGFILQVLSVIWIIFYIRDRRAKKRFKEESLNLDVEIRELEGERDELIDQLYGISGNTNVWLTTTTRDYFIPLREDKKDFLPKKKMKHHTLEEPIEYYSEDEEYGGAPFCDNCYDTTDYEYPF